jgi:regulator of sigma E protease
MNTVFGFILVLGVLILVHEWGHYIVARLFGVRVDVFSIGFGPRLFGFKRGATDWRVSAIPLGGYVRMAGQDISEVDSGDTVPTGASDELMSKKRWQRALISFAGPAINLIFPIFLLTGFFLLRGEPYPKYNDKPLVILDIQKDSPLVAAGVAKGDRITSLDGVNNPTWGTVETELAKGVVNRSFHLVVDRQGESRSLDVSTAGMQTPDLLFGYPPNTPIVGEADKSQPAYQAGVRRDDVILSINGQSLDNWPAMVEAIQQSDGKPLPILVRRKSQDMQLLVTPKKGQNERGATVWLIGIRPSQEYSFRKVSVSQALASAGRFTWMGTTQVFSVVGKLLTGKLAVKQLQSVVGIANEAGHAVQEGTFAVVSLMAVFSLNLGVMNLLPIPILDGGHILLLSIEGIRRRDFSLAFKERFIQVGLVFLLALFAYVMYNDVVRLLPVHL